MRLHRLFPALLLALSGFTLSHAAPAARPAARPATKATAAPKAAPAAAIQKVASVEGITEYRLANGMRVLLFPDPSKQTITVNITYLVGSRHENYGETGMAHLLEHLLFKGTPKHRNIPQELTAHGARPNGTTWLDRTNYYETFAASDANLQWALELEADRMVNSFIAKKDLDSEMTVVRNEFEMGENSPSGILIQRALSTAYLWHNYGNSTIGARADIENVPIERLRAFYRTYYQPDNAVLLVAGKFDPNKALALIRKNFAPIPRPKRTLPKLYTVEPTQDGERLVTLRRTGDVQLVAGVYHVPPGAHPDFAAIDLMTQILADTPSGRLHKALVEPKKASSVFGFNFQLREPGVVMFGAEVRQESSLEDARAALVQATESFAGTAPTAEEVERARTALLKNIELALNSTERIGTEMSEWIALGDWRLFFLHRDRIAKVTPADVQRVAGAYLRPSNRTVAMFVPTPKPERARVATVSNAEIAAMVRNYKGNTAVAAGEAFDPSPANIEKRTRRSTLPGGLELALLPKKTRGATVAATLTLRFGDEKSLMNRSTAASLTGEMLLRGTTEKTRQQIQDAFDRLKARVSVSGGPTQAVVRVETVRENLPAVMRLVGEVLRKPAFPASEFDQLKQETLASIEQQRSDPQSIGFTEWSRRLNPYPKGDVRYVSTADEDIAEVTALTLDDVKGFYRDFYGASNAQLAVVGDFDEKQVPTLAAELLGDWKSPRPYVRVPREYKAVAPTTASIEAPDKANAIYVAGMNLNLRDDDPDYPALVLGNYLLGGGFLNSRLATRVRQNEGLSYGVGSDLSADPLDKSGTFMTYAIYAPQNAARLETAIRGEVARALKDGFTAKEIEEAKSGFLQTRQVGRAQDAGLAGRLSTYLFLDRTLAWDADFEKRFRALTPQQVNQAMRRHIDPAKITVIKVGDFAKGAAGGAPAPAATGPVK
uniref:Zinc protease n=1 Tax=uncultured Armatimonadetes bacterium TaxID=157466 RepID=A0A6J4JU27_9BACT|nr:Zinc protease [uncultured Armatimonadetes bacterium]